MAVVVGVKFGSGCGGEFVVVLGPVVAGILVREVAEVEDSARARS